MTFVGELSDRSVAENLILQFRSRGIECEMRVITTSQSFQLFVLHETDYPAASDIFLTTLRLPRAVEIDEEWLKIKRLSMGDTTRGILILCVALFLLSYSEMGKKLYDLFFIGKVESGFMSEVARGEIWRLITPIFLHLSLLHILFNMLWFKDLSSIIEVSFGREKLLIMIFIIGVFSNIFQYAINGPQFGGMSGVLYGLLGFIWLYHKLDPQFDFTIPKRDMAIMMIWLLLCLTGLFGPIANTAHAAGLLGGVIYALYLSAGKTAVGVKERIGYLLVSIFVVALTIAVEYWRLSGRLYLLITQF